MKGNKVYASAAHPDGPNPHAIFTISDKGTIHTTIDHPGHQSGDAVFVLGSHGEVHPMKKPDAAFIKRTIEKESGGHDAPKNKE